MVALLMIRAMLRPIPTLAFLAAALPASAQPNWSFIDHPHPHLADHSAEEYALVKPADSAVEACTQSLENAYLLYQRRYPAFASFAEQEGMKNRWRLATMRLPGAHRLWCPYGDVDKALRDNIGSGRRSDFYYCGRLSTVPETPGESAVAKAISSLEFSARNGEANAAAYLLRLDRFPSGKPAKPGIDFVVRLNPDIELALKTLAENANNAELNAVFDQTPPCPPL